MDHAPPLLPSSSLLNQAHVLAVDFMVEQEALAASSRWLPSAVK